MQGRAANIQVYVGRGLQELFEVPSTLPRVPVFGAGLAALVIATTARRGGYVSSALWQTTSSMKPWGSRKYVA